MYVQVSPLREPLGFLTTPTSSGTSQMGLKGSWGVRGGGREGRVGTSNLRPTSNICLNLWFPQQFTAYPSPRFKKGLRGKMEI